MGVRALSRRRTTPRLPLETARSKSRIRSRCVSAKGGRPRGIFVVVSSPRIASRLPAGQKDAIAFWLRHTASGKSVRERMATMTRFVLVLAGIAQLWFTAQSLDSPSSPLADESYRAPVCRRRFPFLLKRRKLAPERFWTCYPRSLKGCREKRGDFRDVRDVECPEKLVLRDVR